MQLVECYLTAAEVVLVGQDLVEARVEEVHAAERAVVGFHDALVGGRG